MKLGFEIWEWESQKNSKCSNESDVHSKLRESHDLTCGFVTLFGNPPFVIIMDYIYISFEKCYFDTVKAITPIWHSQRDNYCWSDKEYW